MCAFVDCVLKLVKIEYEHPHAHARAHTHTTTRIKNVPTLTSFMGFRSYYQCAVQAHTVHSDFSMRYL